MTMLNDPDMKEIVDEFCSESKELCSQLEDILDDYEDDLSQTQLLEKFGQIIDRIMGAAKSIEANSTGNFCELGKIVSYKASQINDQKLLSIVAAVLFDTVDIVNNLIDSISKKQEEIINEINIDKFSERLKWILDKLSHVDRASVAIEEVAADKQKNIDDLLSDLGL